jgi:hypothetical protein
VSPQPPGFRRGGRLVAFVGGLALTVGRAPEPLRAVGGLTEARGFVRDAEGGDADPLRGTTTRVGVLVGGVADGLRVLEEGRDAPPTRDVVGRLCSTGRSLFLTPLLDGPVALGRLPVAPGEVTDPLDVEGRFAPDGTEPVVEGTVRPVGDRSQT